MNILSTLRSMILVVVIAVVTVMTSQPLAASTPTAPSAGAEIPDTPAGFALDWILRALASGGEPLTAEHLQLHISPEFLNSVSIEEMLAGIREFSDAYGPFTLDGFARPPATTQLVALISGAEGSRFAIDIMVEPDSPHQVLGVSIQPTSLSPTTGTDPYGGLIDIGDRRLFLSCIEPAEGWSGPTVVLEAGYGNVSTIWLTVQNMLGEKVRVCAYDRANAPGGASDPAPTPRTGADVVADLEALLDAAGVPGPYVLVGHSLGGHFVRLYAGAHPDQAAGVVLVDPSHEDQEARREQLVGPELWARYQSATAVMTDPEGFDLVGLASEVRTARTDTPLPEVPLVVLTHGLAPDDPEIPAEWPIGAEERLWRELHADLASLVPGGRLIVAEQSGHFIQLDQPDLVADAIREVVTEPRDQPGPTGGSTP